MTQKFIAQSIGCAPYSWGTTLRMAMITVSHTESVITDYSLMYTTFPPRWCTMMAFQKTLNQCLSGVGPVSLTVAQHQTRTESGSRVFWIGPCLHRHSSVTVGDPPLSGMLACKDHKPSYDWWSYDGTLGERWIGRGAPSIDVKPAPHQCYQKISCCKDNDQRTICKLQDIVSGVYCSARKRDKIARPRQRYFKGDSQMCHDNARGVQD